ncbi:MAG: hypothetical protein GXP41_10040 [Chloroflexi bacterium]|nr:hypothetical protein [Chloroflexota bacterium]
MTQPKQTGAHPRKKQTLREAAAEYLATHPRVSIEERLAQYEHRYNLSSAEFYARYMRGEYPCEEWDYFRWAGIYELHLRRNGTRNEPQPTSGHSF